MKRLIEAVERAPEPADCLFFEQLAGLLAKSMTYVANLAFLAACPHACPVRMGVNAYMRVARWISGTRPENPGSSAYFLSDPPVSLLNQ